LKNDCFGIAISPNGKEFVTCGNSLELITWNIETGKEVYKAFTAEMNLCISYSPDGKMVACGARENRNSRSHRIVSDYVVLSLMPNKECKDPGPRYGSRFSTGYQYKDVNDIPAHHLSIHACKFSNDGKMVASGSADKTVKLCNVAENIVHCARFSLDGKSVIVGGFPGKINIYE